jgi:murein DD-endopeptidase MepM/ murein hydrolase activator NlpD
MSKLLAIGERLGGVFRRQPAFFAIAVPLAIPLLLATVSLHDPAALPAIPTSSSPEPALRYAELIASRSPAQLPDHSVIIPIEEDDTLDAVLLSGGLARQESAMLTNEFAKSVDVRRLRPGHLVRFHYDLNGRPDSIELKIYGWGEVDALRNGDHFDVTKREAQIHEIETTISAQIDSSLYEALRNAGEMPQLAQQLVDVFQWDIDFFALKKGDSFSVVVKKRYAGSDLLGYGPITAARFMHDGDRYEAFRSESGDRAGYYAANGTPLRKQFLRAPLAFTRITSTFSNHRFHPLLHYFRPHHGVDYGAPVGTPVMTTADGVVVDAMYNRGEGNFVRIRHTSRIETSYLHLSRFAKGIKRGAKVMQGQVIGYVGMTGLATGPHLDYRVSDGGTWLDPLKLRSITPDPLHGDVLSDFRGNVARLMPRLAAPPNQIAQTFVPKRRALF